MAKLLYDGLRVLLDAEDKMCERGAPIVGHKPGGRRVASGLIERGIRNSTRA